VEGWGGAILNNINFFTTLPHEINSKIQKTVFVKKRLNVIIVGNKTNLSSWTNHAFAFFNLKLKHIGLYFNNR